MSPASKGSRPSLPDCLVGARPPSVGFVDQVAAGEPRVDQRRRRAAHNWRAYGSAQIDVAFERRDR